MLIYGQPEPIYIEVGLQCWDVCTDNPIHLLLLSLSFQKLGSRGYLAIAADPDSEQRGSKGPHEPSSISGSPQYQEWHGTQAKGQRRTFVGPEHAECCRLC